MLTALDLSLGLKVKWPCSHPITACSASERVKAVMSSLCGDLVCNGDESGFLLLTLISYLRGLTKDLFHNRGLFMYSYIGI